MNLVKWRHGSVSEGPRRNTTIWTAGCSIRCKGCFNTALWNPLVGQKVGLVQFLNTVLDGRDKGDDGLAIVGGEPFDQPWLLGWFLLWVKLLIPTMTITVYTGNVLEKLRKNLKHWLALRVIDVLVDGPFIQEVANDNLGYRGSANQRVIDLVVTRSNRWQIHQLEWDNLIVIGDGYITGPESLLGSTPGVESAECGLLESEVAHGTPVNAHSA